MQPNSIPEFGELTGPGEVRLVRLLPGAIDRVWLYLTDAKKRGTWLAPGPMDLRVGGKVELRFHHADLTPHREEIPEKYREMCSSGQAVIGKVTKCEPPKLLAYTWGEADGQSSEVTFELSARGEKTLLVITHRRLSGRDMITSVAAGWHTHVGILADNLAGKTPQPFWSTHAKLEAEYDSRL